MIFDELPKPAGGLDRIRREGNGGSNAVHLAVAAVDRAITRIAQPGCRFGDGIEDRLQVEGRAADDLEHVAGCGLVFERLLKIARALAQFVEQADILDGDDGLVGEGLEQLDLRFGECFDPVARHGDRAERIAVLQHRHR